jgi:protein TonB
MYPEESRIAQEQGIVMLRVEVTAAGEPVSVSILKSSGFFRLDQAARRAVQHWKFHPGMTAGIPVPSEAEVPVHFKLQ